MRIRLPFAGAFIGLLVLAGYAGLSSLQLNGIINDKVLHFLTFFLLTVCFYWVLDSSRNRNLKLTLVVCTGILGVGSEFVQGMIPENGRNFDFYDIVANVLGSLSALALSSWYHKRMLERKRAKRGYSGAPVVDGDQNEDLELGTGQESGIVHHDTAPAAVSLEQELDNWDENAEDAWDNEDDVTNGAATTVATGRIAPGSTIITSATEVEEDTKNKRAD